MLGVRLPILCTPFFNGLVHKSLTQKKKKKAFISEETCMQPLEHEKIHEKNSFTPILSENEDYFKKKFKE